MFDLMRNFEFLFKREREGIVDLICTENHYNKKIIIITYA